MHGSTLRHHTVLPRSAHGSTPNHLMYCTVHLPVRCRHEPTNKPVDMMPPLMQRGIKIHSLEVTRYQCADSSTAAILEAIIQETTNVSQLDGGRGWSWIYTIWLLSVGARGWWASTWCTHRCVRPLGVHSRGMTISRALLPAVEGLPRRPCSLSPTP